jgi:hypothetical protein
VSEPARCIWCKAAVSGHFALGSACPHCGKVPLLLESIPEVRQEHSYGNEPTRIPDLAGDDRRAWRVPVDNAPEGHAGVGCDWLVHRPGAHPLWWWYMVAIVHLRPLHDLDRPAIQFPGATHEALIVSLDPEHELPDLDTWGPAHMLQPPDLAAQFIVNSDAQAAEVGDLLVTHIVIDGQSPDSDHRSYWTEAVENTAEHLRLGGHPPAEGAA